MNADRRGSEKLTAFVLSSNPQSEFRNSDPCYPWQSVAISLSDPRSSALIRGQSGVNGWALGEWSCAFVGVTQPEQDGLGPVRTKQLKTDW